MREIYLQPEGALAPLQTIHVPHIQAADSVSIARDKDVAAAQEAYFKEFPALRQFIEQMGRQTLKGIPVRPPSVVLPYGLLTQHPEASACQKLASYMGYGSSQEMAHAVAWHFPAPGLKVSHPENYPVSLIEYDASQIYFA